MKKKIIINYKVESMDEYRNDSEKEVWYKSDSSCLKELEDRFSEKIAEVKAIETWEETKEERSKFDKLLNLFVFVSVGIHVVMVLASLFGYMMVPKSEQDFLVAWQKSYNKMYSDILKDAEYGVEKNVSDYTMYCLVPKDYWNNQMKYYTAQYACMPLTMDQFRYVISFPYAEVSLVKMSSSSENFTNIQLLESERKAKEIAKQINLTGYHTIESKLDAVELIIAQNVTYLFRDEHFKENVKQKNAREAWACLVTSNEVDAQIQMNEAVCAGYAKATYMICKELGIPCINVLGGLNTTEINHLWNLVYVNGQWLHLDITNCDIDNNENVSEKSLRKNLFFLVSDETCNQYLKYDQDAIAAAIRAYYPELLDESL